ncbi:AraC family transcriptional regulator [Leptospira sp. severe_002]|uniref:AraC family transcriptional regulator n=1 Tax=Leptospira sp. severe_002 TaxID=2838237 RepID=UPI001E5C03BB|nr:AraC family transcriptional regulator [Leptospira sp. severe_002]
MTEIATLHLESASFTGPDRVEAFRETYGRTLMQLDIEPLPGHPFELDFTVYGVPGFGIATGRLSPTRNTHTSAMISDDDVVLVFTPQGSGTLSQIGREATIQNGEALLVSNGEPGVFLGNIHSRLTNFRFNRAMLEAQAVDIDTALIRPIPRSHPALRLITGYASVMGDGAALETPELRRAVVQHMHDLAAILLGATRDGAEIAKRRGVRAARLRAIKEDILAGLSRQTLSAETLAKRHGITPRYVNMLFEAEGVSFSEFVLAQRLARVHRMLGDPRFADRPISAIAFEVGFGDLSYFNRTFRRRYGLTPSDVRTAAQNP